MTKIETLVREIGGNSTEDWRDIFQTIHNIGYNSDFTYDPVTDTERTSLEGYLKRLIEIVNED